jgi:hypothetical protein
MTDILYEEARESLRGSLFFYTEKEGEDNGEKVYAVGTRHEPQKAV